MFSQLTKRPSVCGGPGCGPHAPHLLRWQAPLTTHLFAREASPNPELLSSTLMFFLPLLLSKPISSRLLRPSLPDSSQLPQTRAPASAFSSGSTCSPVSCFCSCLLIPFPSWGQGSQVPGSTLVPRNWKCAPWFCKQCVILPLPPPLVPVSSNFHASVMGKQKKISILKWLIFLCWLSLKTSLTSNSPVAGTCPSGGSEDQFLECDKT